MAIGPTLLFQIILLSGVGCQVQCSILFRFELKTLQVAQTLFVSYIRDSIALCFEPLKRMYENGLKIAPNSTCSKGFK